MITYKVFIAASEIDAEMARRRFVNDIVLTSYKNGNFFKISKCCVHDGSTIYDERIDFIVGSKPMHQVVSLYTGVAIKEVQDDSESTSVSAKRRNCSR